MRTIIAGSRGITDFDVVLSAIKESKFDITEVVSGTAKGVDQLGERYANAEKLPCVKFKPDWNKYGLSAGYKRNSLMAQYAEALIAIWDGSSKGTEHMINEAKMRGLKVFVFFKA